MSTGRSVASPSSAPVEASEEGVVFDCEGCRLVGVLHAVEAEAGLGVVLVVGGPQYRVGSHRQFLLLARTLAANGVPVLRFDYRGMGDSEGESRGFLNVDADIRAAVDTLTERCPALDGVVLWGLCDGATASACYAGSDPRVKGAVLLNPWVHSELGEAKTFLRHYYLQRLLSAGFWRKFVSGRVDMRASVRSFAHAVATAFGIARQPQTESGRGDTAVATAARSSPDLVAMMGRALSRFTGPVLLVTSGRDLTAQEFIVASNENRALGEVLAGANVQRVSMADADHTFSRARWRDEVASHTCRWIDSLHRHGRQH